MVGLLNYKYDVIIIGAGPAGSSAAYFLKEFDRENKLDICLIECLKEDKFFRYHEMCGEGVSNLIKKDIPKINFRKFIKNKIKKIIEVWGKTNEIKSKVNGYIIDRPKFLEYLINKFKEMDGFFLNDIVIDINNRRNMIKIKLRSKEIINSKYLIIASGVKDNNIITKFLGHEKNVFTTFLYQIVLRDYKHEKDSLIFFYDEKYNGDYKWIFPYGELTKIGLPYSNKNEIKYLENSNNFLRRDIRKIGYGVLENYNKQNVIFIGDAAFQTNPLTKGGIRIGINAAKIAAESIVKYGNPNIYDEKWKKSRFFSLPFMKSFEIIKTMKNDKLSEHIEPFKNNLIRALLLIHFNKKYKSYKNLYKSYNLSFKYGW